MKFSSLALRRKHIVTIVSFLVGLYGLYIIGSTLLDLFIAHRLRINSSALTDVHLLFGLGFVYLSLLLARRKRNAFVLGLLAFTFLFGEGTSEVLTHLHSGKVIGQIIFRYAFLPLAILILLLLTRNEFKVKSDTQAFKSSLSLAIIVLIITLAYGIGGFLLMDNSDFRQEISVGGAIQHTIDQFDLTTNQPLHPYTKRARIFMDSLSFVSIASVTFLVVSLVQPVRARLADQSEQRQRLLDLMKQYGAPSEDFFKLWPHDKHYFFDSKNEAGLAYHVKRGVALVLADPVGNADSFRNLLKEFSELCWVNDWQPALIHVDAKYRKLYERAGYELQLIGQEAFVNIEQFVSSTSTNKYFRNIRNRFTKENYSFEILQPPHHQAVLDRVKAISDDWLSKPGRTERGFVMGYYNEEYLQQCELATVRDAAQTIQAFLNIIPSSDFNKDEVTYDMLRASALAPPNCNDFLLMGLIQALHEQGKKTLSLGLAPLVGLDEPKDENNLISRVLSFAYTNGDRIYSFSGLKRFKAKYEPQWEDRFLGYKGGVRGFSRMLNALLFAMRLPKGVRLKR